MKKAQKHKSTKNNLCLLCAKVIYNKDATNKGGIRDENIIRN